MFRIAPDKPKGPPAPPLPEPESPEEAAAEGGESGEESLGSYPSKLIPQPIVVYMTSDMGPFTCDNCINWQEPDSCGVVAGTIDPKGKCNIYEPKNQEQGPDASQPPSGAPNDNMVPLG